MEKQADQPEAEEQRDQVKRERQSYNMLIKIFDEAFEAMMTKARMYKARVEELEQ